MPARAEVRHLVVVLGDQLDRASSAFDGFDPAHDLVWMCEASEEATHVWSSQPRIALFLSAMRHFAQALRDEGLPLAYLDLHEGGLGAALHQALAARRVQRVVLAEPGDWRVREALRAAAAEAGVPIEIRPDRHFLCSSEDFARHARGRKQLRMETFYREMRRRHRVLMDDSDEDQPAGGQWNYDADNRGAFGPQGPGLVPPPLRFEPDAITREVIALVKSRFGAHPGRLERFGWPVTQAQARAALDDFIEHRLADFGRWQDAMWGGQPWLYHAQIAAAMNLKLLDPRAVVAAAEAAWRAGRVPLASAEGFIRQVLGWREYVRGIYWTQMPGYAALNALDARQPLPAWYWTGDTDMRCLADAIGQTLEHGYAHHIQRLMVTGLYALLLGVEPQQVHGWYLSVYVDAVEWVELPNTLGMSQYADGGRMASKPYAATGQYIQRMSDHCRGCRYDPTQRHGERACPFTTLYWDFLARHERRFATHPRMALQVKNLARLPAEELRAIREQADAIRGRDGAAA
ncbi:cryptochrome/photolyase family protein [uncultured Methylibium sp.]|uniref:cryptochrome/photolyase family protein n=1 Tax=uncultured Methylibium sp. TaxID=381093 RepID=UPI0025EF64F8|nr:cryptochrome/photolyase family protein [uncultured Methylibium sp.]